MKLAFIGSIKDELIQSVELTMNLISYLKEQYPGCLKEKYSVEEDGVPERVLEEIAGKDIVFKRVASLTWKKHQN
jgi:ribosome biogenesis GTPase A